MATKKKVEKVKPLPPALGGEELLVDPEAKANFWKPKVEGETRIGKFLGKTSTTYGEVLNVDTVDGLCQIPVSVVLKKVDWDKFTGRNLFFQYIGTKKRYRMYLVKALEQ